MSARAGSQANSSYAPRPARATSSASRPLVIGRNGSRSRALPWAGRASPGRRRPPLVGRAPVRPPGEVRPPARQIQPLPAAARRAHNAGDEPGIISRWAVTRETTASADEIGVDGCPTEEASCLVRRGADHLPRPLLVPGDRRRRGRVAPQATELRVRITGTLRADDPILIAVSAPEVRPSSFDMTFRVRGLGDDGSVIADGRCTMVLVDPATGESRPVPASLRRDLMDIEAAATDYC